MKPYEFSELSLEEMNRMVILENIKKTVELKNIVETMSQFGQIQDARLILLKNKKFAFVKFKEKDLARILTKKNKKIKKNRNISIFKHSLARNLINEHSQEINDKIAKFSKPKHFAELI